MKLRNTRNISSEIPIYLFATIFLTQSCKLHLNMLQYLLLRLKLKKKKHLKHKNKKKYCLGNNGI